MEKSTAKQLNECGCRPKVCKTVDSMVEPYTSDVDSTVDSSGSESENVPLAELFGLNTSSNNAMSADLTVSNSSMDHQMEEEPSLQMDQTNEGNSFVFIICRISINKIQL